ncbi:MAG: hypothetical protein ISR65_12620 [Bacteriovoracaceae bacterium]|nr:hypothetical protein [Bacteriovoracaceae bacterium]
MNYFFKIFASGKFIPFLWFLITASAHSTEEIRWEQLTTYDIQEMHIKLQVNTRLEDLRYLKMAKTALISGELEKASYSLGKISHQNFTLSHVKRRYFAIINFLKENYLESLQLIGTLEGVNVKNYSQNCLLKLINLLALKDVNTLRVERIKCQKNTLFYSKNNQIWLDSMLDLRDNNFEFIKHLVVRNIQYPTEDLSNILDSHELTQIWLKIGLYTNQHDALEKHLANLPMSAFRSKRVRELLGLTYYRLGKLDLAIKFIEDIQTANVENIKANIKLKNNDYEMAYGHLKLALRKKSNSLNALNRAIPLAWILEQWQDGLAMLSKLYVTAENEKQVLALAAGLNIRLNNLKKAQEHLILLEHLYDKFTSKEVDYMYSYLAAILGDVTKLKIYANKACRRLDGLNCWVKLQQLVWPDFKRMIHREKKVLIKNNSNKDSFSLASLKSAPVISNLKEAPIFEDSDLREISAGGGSK